MRYRMNLKSVALVTASAMALAACGAGEEATTTEAMTDTTMAMDTTMPMEETTTTMAMDTTMPMEETTTTEPMGTTMPMEEEAGDPFALLKMAAHHVGNDGTAQALAGGVAQGAELEGDLEAPAVGVYAGASTLLQEHVYLAGIAVDIGVSFGLDSPAFEAAAAALDENSVELADLIGAVAPDQRDAFLDLWREHIGFFVDYTAGAAGGDEAMMEQALADLGAYSNAAGAFFEEITAGALPAAAVEESLGGHIDTLIAAIDAAVAGEPAVFDNLKMAAHHVGEQGTALALASGVAQAAELEGDLEAPGVQAYVTLSTLLEEHVYLAGIAVKTAFAAGPDSPAYEAAAATLDENSVELADVIGTVAPDQRDAFLDLWREHIGFFVDYALGAAGDDQAMKDQALADLEGYGAAAGAFFEEITAGALPAAAVEESLAGHIDTLAAAIDALAIAVAG